MVGISDMNNGERRGKGELSFGEETETDFLDRLRRGKREKSRSYGIKMESKSPTGKKNTEQTEKRGRRNE